MRHFRFSEEILPILAIFFALIGTGCGKNGKLSGSITQSLIASGSRSGALSAVAVSSTQIDVTWAPNSESDLAGYKIYRDNIVIALVQRNQTNFSNNGLSPSTTYMYQISAFDMAGNESNRSQPVSATTFSK